MLPKYLKGIENETYVVHTMGQWWLWHLQPDWLLVPAHYCNMSLNVLVLLFNAYICAGVKKK